MKKILLLGFIVAVSLFFNAFTFKNNNNTKNVFQDSLSEDRLKHVNEIKEMIKGKEDMEADSVYKNLQSIGGFKASILPLVMNKWSIALGVSCGYCHENGKWELDNKKEKLVARKMAKMSSVINDYLKTVKEIQNPHPVINCSSCHRGHLKPALDVTAAN
jgi:hypothetical protein